MYITLPFIPLLIIFLIFMVIKTRNVGYIESFGPDVKYPTIIKISEIDDVMAYIYDNSNMTLEVGDYFVYDKSVYQVKKILDLLDILNDNESAVNAKYCSKPLKEE